MVKETENPFGDDEDEDPASLPHQGPSTPGSSLKAEQQRGSSLSSSKESKEKDKKKKEKDRKARKPKPFNLEAEKEQMKANIADASIAATNLMNTLQSINRERERISENQVALQRFEECKQLRRRILRFVSLTERSINGIGDGYRMLTLRR